MSLYGSFAQENHFSELGTPLVTQAGVKSAATRRAAALANLSGVAMTATQLSYLAGVTAGTTTASKALVVGANKNLDALAIADGGFSLGAGAGTAVLSTAAELNKLDDSAVVMTKGAGVSAMETYANGAFQNGTLKRTFIVIDLTGLVGSATDLDIIGNSGGATSAHIGQITAALNGAIVGGRVTCLEVPAGGSTDIDFYSATESTGAQDALVTGLTETALVTAGGAWASGTVKGMTLLPAADSFLYVANGAASGGTFSAGKFLIELFGT